MRLVVLDAVRFVAAVLVAMYHFTLGYGLIDVPFIIAIARYGYLGAPVFFIISGYVILLSADNRKAGEFAVARIVRLYPTFWLCLAITVAVLAISGHGMYSGTAIVANLTMLNNFMHVNDIDGLYWTLHSEIKFYGIVFLLLATGLLKKYRLWIGVWILFTAAKLVVGHLLAVGRPLDMGSAPFFLCGAGLFLVQKEGPGRISMLLLVVPVILACIKSFEQTSDYMAAVTVVERTVSALIIVLFVAALAVLVRGNVKVPDHRVLVVLGGASYPFYLLHNQAGKVLLGYLMRHLPVGAAVPVTIVVVIIVAVAIHTVFEKRVSWPLKGFLLEKYKEITARAPQG